ncbi:general substrate transporter [Aureobasidium pullulans]|uniref:General substrate transporter n=1 Tax=Aureobasidium pullulans TaxID=5580 RepID=A0A4S9SXI2_AURPU|nr:general substrate transporter [Aureobasidium pullulans]
MAFSHTGFLGDRMTGKALEIGVCATASAGFLLFGYDQGVMSGIITEPIFLGTFPKMAEDYKLGSIQALVVAIYEIGCLIGSFIIIGYGDKLGRRRAVLVGAAIMLVGTAIQTSSTTLAQLIIGRIVTGAGNGMNTSSIPVWQSEMAPPKIRGFLVLFEGALITGGVMISYWVNYGFWFYNKSSFQWRFPVAFQAFFGIILIIGILAFPESPRWLLKHGKEKEAAQIMARLKQCDVEDQELQKDIEDIKKINEITAGRKLTVKEFCSNGPDMHLWRASIAFAAQAFQQIGGINLVTYYATVVFENSLGFDPTFARLLTGVLGTEYFLSALVALFVVDRLGRRRLMMWNAAGMGLAMMVAGIGLSVGNQSGAYAATVMIFLFNTFFAIGWLGVTWLYPAEVTPIRIRAEANGLSTSANWLFNYAVVQLSPIMINTIAWKTYFVFMCFNFAFIPVVYYTFVETNGYKLEAMDTIFQIAHKNKENPVWVEKRVRKGNTDEAHAVENKSSSTASGEGEKEKVEDTEHKEDA